MSPNYRSVRCPKAATEEIRDEFIRLVAESRRKMPLDRAMSSVRRQICAVGMVSAPIALLPQLDALVADYVPVQHKYRKRETPQT